MTKIPDKFNDSVSISLEFNLWAPKTENDTIGKSTSENEIAFEMFRISLLVLIWLKSSLGRIWEPNNYYLCHDWNW